MKKIRSICLLFFGMLMLFILPVTSFANANSPNIAKAKFEQYWDGELNYLNDDLLIGLSYGHSASGIYSYDIRISESSNTASFTVTCYTPQSYTKERISEYYNKFISSILKTVGYQNTKIDWSPYIAYGMSGSKKHVYLNGYDFYFYTKTTHEYPRWVSKNGVDMTEFCLDVSEVKNAEYVYETIADIYCISGVASCGDTLTLPSEVQGKVIEGIIINKPYSIYDENIKTIVIGSQMHTVPVSTLNMVFPNLEAFVVGNNNPYIAQIDGCLYNKKAKTLIACPATKTELVIPEGIVGIEHFACQYAKKLTKVEIPSTCTIIGTSAFEECTSLKEIKFAESSSWVIEEKAFNGCTSLPELDLSATLCVEIEANAFSGCTKLAKLQFSNTLKKIGNNAFENSPIKEIILPNGLETIGESVFDSKLRSVAIPANVKEFYSSSFTPYCMVSIDSNNEYYYEKNGVVFSQANELIFYPYNAKKDTVYEIPNGTTAILCNLGSHLTELTIPSSVKKISVRLTSIINGITLYVESGSYAESYAIEKQYNYESKIVESNDLDWLYAPQENTASALDLLGTQFSNESAGINAFLSEQGTESAPDDTQPSFHVEAFEVPGGRYIIGEDIPAGDYTISISTGSTNLTVWGAAYHDYNAKGGLLLNVSLEANKNNKLEKVVLEDGNIIDFSSSLTFKSYIGLSFSVTERTVVPGGCYTVGKDIPAGTYTISIEKESTNLTIWGSKYNDYSSNGGLLLNVGLSAKNNQKLGKVVLNDGNIINFSFPLIFEPYKGFGNAGNAQKSAVAEVKLDGSRAPGVCTQETNIGDFIADAFLWSAKQVLGEEKVHASLTNGGGIRASIEKGKVTSETIRAVYPFGDEVVILKVTGSELLEAIEAATWCIPEASVAFPQVSGIEYTINTSVPYNNGLQYPGTNYYAPAKPGARVTIYSVDGKPWAADAVYTIATNDYTAAGGDSYHVFRLPFKKTGQKVGVSLEKSLMNYLQTALDGIIGEQYAQDAGRIIIK